MVSALCLTPSCLGTKIFCVQTSECSGLNIISNTNTNRKHFRVNYGFQGPPTDKYCLVTAKVHLWAYTCILQCKIVSNVCIIKLLIIYLLCRLQMTTNKTQNQIVSSVLIVMEMVR